MSSMTSVHVIAPHYSGCDNIIEPKCVIKVNSPSGDASDVDSLNLLKQEINQTLESEHDFAKWKLIVAAALGGVALGLDKSGSAHIWLLLLIPFACAYIDLHLSQYQARILVLAQFIRHYQASGHGEDVDNTLSDYEKYC